MAIAKKRACPLDDKQYNEKLQGRLLRKQAKTISWFLPANVLSAMGLTTPLLRALTLCTAFLIVVPFYWFMRATPLKNQTSFINDEHLSLPWYKQPHKRIIQSTMTSHLSPAERNELYDRRRKEARDKASQVFGDVFTGVIPGSIIETQDQAQALRSLVDCWTRGRWAKTNVVSPIRHFQDPIYNTCDNKFYKTHNKTEWRNAVRYQWQPSCPLPAIAVDPENWCRALDGRDVALVGDLVHYQMHELLLDALRDGPVVCYGELSCKGVKNLFDSCTKKKLTESLDHTICTKPKEAVLRYLRNDLLVPTKRITLNDGHPSGVIVDYPFTYGNSMARYKIYILNRAPVAENDETFIRHLIASIRTLRQVKPDALIIYRSTSVGHPFCNEADSPLDGPLTEAERQELPYGWSEQARRNAMAREIVEAAGGLYVDLAALTDLRPDGHVGGQDCLRYCMPGPLDAWALILYNVMLALEGQLPIPPQ